MFTVRFIRPDRDYKSYSVTNYEVSRESNGEARIELSRKLNGKDAYTEFVGEDSPFCIAYVTNLEGKTIDVIRQLGHEEPGDA